MKVLYTGLPMTDADLATGAYVQLDGTNTYIGEPSGLYKRVNIIVSVASLTGSGYLTASIRLGSSTTPANMTPTNINKVVDISDYGTSMILILDPFPLTFGSFQYASLKLSSTNANDTSCTVYAQVFSMDATDSNDRVDVGLVEGETPQNFDTDMSSHNNAGTFGAAINSIFGKLPNKDYLPGTDNSTGIIDSDSVDAISSEVTVTVDLTEVNTKLDTINRLVSDN